MNTEVEPGEAAAADQRPPQPSPFLASRLALMLLGLALLPVAAWVAYEGQRQFRADWLTLPVRQKVEVWVSGAKGPASQADWDDSVDRYTRAATITPDNASTHEKLGDLYVVAAQKAANAPELRKKHLDQAIARYRDALALRPADAATWAAMTTAMAFGGVRGPELNDTWARALSLGPNEGHVQPMLLEAALISWNEATPEMQRWVTSRYESADANTRIGINNVARYYGLQFKADDEAAPAQSNTLK